MSNAEIFHIKCSDESSQTFIFPEGVSKFAASVGASLIHLEPDFAYYYHTESSLWKAVEDLETEPPVSRGSVTSIRKGSDKHQP